MKLLVTTATAAFFAAGMAFAADGLAKVDTDASGDISLTEAQTYDPSVTADAFGEFDADADGVLDATEFAAWESEMGSTTGQGDADFGADADLGLGHEDMDAEAGADLGVDTNIDSGIDSDVDLDAGAGIE